MLKETTLTLHYTYTRCGDESTAIYLVLVWLNLKSLYYCVNSKGQTDFIKGHLSSSTLVTKNKHAIMSYVFVSLEK